MKELTKILFIVVCLCLPIALQAQKKDDSRYLTGAVPEENGKVVFSKTFGIPGMSQDDIFERMQQWMSERLKKNENNSRVVYTQKEKGEVVGLGEEWIVFKSTALSLDRTKILYMLTALCQPEECTLRIERISYEYREGDNKEKYSAEEWITDKYALNKSKTKLVRGLAKWRRKTIDFVDTLFADAANALSISTPTQPQTATTGNEATSSNAAVAGATIITPKQEVNVKSSNANAQTVPATALSTSYKTVAPDQLSTDLIQMGNGKLVIAIGTDNFNMTTMTANAGGSLGKSSGKPVIFTMLSPDQPYEQLEKAETYTVRFYPNGQNEPSVVLECKKLPSPAPVEGQPRTFIGEIVKALVK